MSESQRGCGFRKEYALYLVSDPGFHLYCDGLPMELEHCDCCGFMPQFTRGLQRISWRYINQAEVNHHMALRARGGSGEVCRCPDQCPICNPKPQITYGLMHVGKKYYTARSFVQEAIRMGVSKRISDVPSWLILGEGETWILLAHDEVPKIPLEKLTENGLLEKEPETFRAVFYAFKPQRIEMPVFKGDLSEEELQLIRKKGITPVLLDPTKENRKKHKTAESRKILEKLLKPELEEEQGDD